MGTATISSTLTSSPTSSYKHISATIPTTPAKYRKGAKVLLHNPEDVTSFLRGTILEVLPSASGWRYRIKVGTADIMWAAVYQEAVVERVVEIPEMRIVTALSKGVSWF
ncbi:hypothetical protein FRC05_010265 [Tulasnella sp. 425]|nr:hypothetical protein FRC05_010265 [Tulasnella sp. 425]